MKQLLKIRASLSFMGLIIIYLLIQRINTGCIYNISNCQTCSNLTECTNCSAGYGFNVNGTYPLECHSCDVINCIKCFTDHTQCNECKNGYGLQNGTCRQCTNYTPNCSQCSANASICTNCINKYRLETSNNSCERCNNSNCLRCDTDIYSCTMCQTPGWGLTPNQTCLSCTVTNCNRCQTNYTNCTYCNTGYGIVPNHNICSNCTQLAECLVCGANNSACEFCIQGLGPHSGTKQCVNCLDSNCLNCSLSAQNCIVCNYTWGVNTTGAQKICVNCSNPYCYNCSTNYQNCTQCKNLSGLNASNKCQPCQYPCFECNLTNNTECVSCVQRHYLNNTYCYPCFPHCKLCLDDNTCQVCDDGYYLNITNKFCYQCPAHCTLCQFDTNTYEQQCTQCISAYYQFTSYYPIRCRQFCGDLYVISDPCDNGLGISYDGCTDMCQIQPGFNCTIQPSNTSLCSYTLPLYMQISEIKKSKYDNKVIIYVDIWPPLHAILHSNISSLFSITSPVFKVSNIVFDSIKSQVIISANFTQDYINEPLTVLFQPSIAVNPEFFASVNSTASRIAQLYFYNPYVYSIGKVTQGLCYTTVVFGWLGCLLGLIGKRLAGLQVMITIQISWLAMVWMSSNLYLPFGDTLPLKYSTGFSKEFFTHSVKNMTKTSSQSNSPTVQINSTAPYLESFGIDRYLFSNNFNLCLVFEFLALAIYLIMAIIIKCYTYQLKKLLDFGDMFDDQIIVARRKLYRISDIRQLSLQALMYFCMLNIVLYTQSVFLFLKMNPLKDYLEIKSLIFIGVGALIYFFTFLMFYLQPYSYDYFRYSFRRTKLSIAHYYFYIVAIVSTILILGFFPKITWAPMIPFGILLVYTAINRPYRQILENIRSCFNILILQSFLGLRVFLTYFHQPSKNSMKTYAFHLINLIFLLIATFVAVAFLIYHFIYIYYIKPKEEKTQKQKVMYELDIINVQQKMRRMAIEDSIFKQIISPGSNILNYSKQMHQYRRNNGKDNFDDNIHKSEKRDLLRSTNITSTNWSEDNKRSLLKCVKQEIINQNVEKSDSDSDRALKAIPQQDQAKPQQTEKIEKNEKEKQPITNKTKINAKNYKKFLEEDQQLTNQEYNYYYNCSKKQQEKINTLAFAYQVVIEEDKFVQLKNALTFIKDKKEPNNKRNMKDFIQAYSNIDENSQKEKSLPQNKQEDKDSKQKNQEK